MVSKGRELELWYQDVDHARVGQVLSAALELLQPRAQGQLRAPARRPARRVAQIGVLERL